jgi:hypothetical protein
MVRTWCGDINVSANARYYRVACNPSRLLPTTRKCVTITTRRYPSTLRLLCFEGHAQWAHDFSVRQTASLQHQSRNSHRALANWFHMEEDRVSFHGPERLAVDNKLFKPCSEHVVFAFAYPYLKPEQRSRSLILMAVALLFTCCTETYLWSWDTGYTQEEELADRARVT